MYNAINWLVDNLKYKDLMKKKILKCQMYSRIVEMKIEYANIDNHKNVHLIF